MLHMVFLVLHIVAGSIAIMFGAMALKLGKHKDDHIIIGEIYQWLFVVFALATCVWAMMASLRLSWSPHLAP